LAETLRQRGNSIVTNNLALRLFEDAPGRRSAAKLLAHDGASHCIVTKGKPQAGCRLGLLSCRLNLGMGAAQLNPAR
jgi:hypothetical protein